MIVVDASVAVKWSVDETGREDALRLLDAGRDLVAPDTIFAELTNVVRKKVRFGQATREQADRAIAGVAATLSRAVSAADLWPEALELSLTLNHSAYDCFYLATALGGGILVSADDKFSRKCRDTGFGAFVSNLAEFPVGPAGTDDAAEAPASLLQEVQRLALLIQTTFDALGRAAARPVEHGRFRFVPSSAFAPAFDSPAYRKLIEILRQLPADQLGYLLALGWLGRPYHDVDQWPTLLANAKEMAVAGFNHHQSYFMAQMSEVGRGLEKLRSAVRAVAPEAKR